MEALQYNLFHETWEQRAFDWIHTPAGGQAMNLFIRIAIGCKRRGLRVGAKLIAERIRWHYEIARKRRAGFKLNNNYTATMARFAEERAPELRGYFSKRSVGTDRHKKKVLVMMK
jgi:hypothetical protein